ncbi:hypothetical protein DTW91_04425 [Chryseobacterium sp. SC28]|nr:hypothetical protein DTW91_04425 [Chryseobacterium sp. SC28]
MKLFIFIFSIYFLALSVMLCTDACGMDTSNTSKSELSNTSNGQTKKAIYAVLFVLVLLVIPL